MDEKPDQKANTQTNGKSKDMKGRIQFLSAKAAEDKAEVVEDHGVGVWTFVVTIDAAVVIIGVVVSVVCARWMFCSCLLVVVAQVKLGSYFFWKKVAFI